MCSNPQRHDLTQALFRRLRLIRLLAFFLLLSIVVPCKGGRGDSILVDMWNLATEGASWPHALFAFGPPLIPVLPAVMIWLLIRDRDPEGCSRFLNVLIGVAHAVTLIWTAALCTLLLTGNISAQSRFVVAVALPIGGTLGVFASPPGPRRVIAVALSATAFYTGIMVLLIGSTGKRVIALYWVFPIAAMVQAWACLSDMLRWNRLIDAPLFVPIRRMGPPPRGRYRLDAGMRVAIGVAASMAVAHASTVFGWSGAGGPVVEAWRERVTLCLVLCVILIACLAGINPRRLFPGLRPPRR